MNTIPEPIAELPNISELPCATSPPTIYASFSLGESEFALPVNQIREVVNAPAEYSSIPLSPSYVLGLFNLRGTIVPVVNLAQIFHPSDNSGNCDSSGKVTILEYGELCIGVLFNSTGEVFNTNLIEQCPFENNKGDLKSRVIQGVFKMDGGSRIVQILNVLELLSLKDIPNTKFHNTEHTQRRTELRKQCISFNVGDSKCALNISTVKEIFAFEKIENTALSSDLCLGAIDIRGATVPIIDFSFLLGYQKSRLNDGIERSVVVLQLESDLFGLLVDSIDSIVNYFADELLPFPVIGTNKEGLFSSCIADSNGTAHIILLEESKIFSDQDIVQITRGHSKLFQSEADALSKARQEDHVRESLITFSLDSHYGVNIRHVKEVVDTPKTLLAPPNSSDYVKGLFNLRGELITVIDSRKLYENSEEHLTPDDTKVLVYESAGQKFGLMVDSVDSIVHYFEKQTIEVPKLARSLSTQNKEAIGNAVDQALATDSATISILNLAKITNSFVAS